MVKGVASFHVKAAVNLFFVEYFILDKIYVKTVKELEQVHESYEHWIFIKISISKDR